MILRAQEGKSLLDSSLDGREHRRRDEVCDRNLFYYKLYSTLTKEFKILQLYCPFSLLQTPPSGPLTLPVSPPSIPGTTCLVALLSDKELTVANVGDSRGVLCDKNGNAVPLSHDHKPYQLKERKRIKKAGEKTDRRTFLHFPRC